MNAHNALHQTDLNSSTTCHVAPATHRSLNYCRCMMTFENDFFAHHQHFRVCKKKSTFDSWKLELIFLRPTQEHDTANVECVGWCLRSLCWWSYEVNEQYFSNTKWLKWFEIFPLKHKTNLRSFMNLMKSIRFDLNQCIPIIQRSCLNNFGIKYLSLNEDVQLKSN